MQNLFWIYIGARYWKELSIVILLAVIGFFWDDIKAWFIDLATSVLWILLYVGIAALAIGGVYAIVKVILDRRAKDKEENTNINEQEQ